MSRKFLLLTLIFVLALGWVLVVPGLRTHSGMLMAQMMGDPEMQYDMQIIHQLSANHAQIHRTVKQLPNGIQASTESDNPQVASLLQTHVSRMYQRLAEGRPFPMIRMVPTLPTLFSQVGNYQRQLQETTQGVSIRETSSDAKLVAVIREHAQEVDQFVQKGMSAMMDGRMR